MMAFLMYRYGMHRISISALNFDMSWIGTLAQS